jgi:hypothetical protein
MAIIGTITCSPSNPKRGESVKFEVLDPQGQSLEGRADVKVTLNSVPGALQWLQFAKSGDHTIIAQARSGETRERQTAKITVASDAMTFRPTAKLTEPAQVPLMRLSQSQTNPYVATFSLGTVYRMGALDPTPTRRVREHKLIDIARTPIRARLSPAERGELRRRARATSPTMKSQLERELTGIAIARDTLPGHDGVRTTRNRRVESKTYDLGAASVDSVLGRVRETIKARYEWTFGDGTTAATTVPYVAHDYFHQLQHAADPIRFQVSCKIVHEGIEVKRTLNLVSAYALCKARGTIVPHFTADIYAHKKFLWFTSSITVYNVEDVPLTLDRQAIVALSDTPTARETPKSFAMLSSPIELGAKSSTVISVSTPIGGTVPSNAAGFTVYYAGSTQNGTPVRMSAIFEVPLAERDQDPEMPRPRWDEILVARTWPWDEVMRAIEEVRANPGPREIAPQKVQLDKATGTLATTWSGLRDVAKLRGTRLVSDRVESKRLAPVYSRNLAVDAPAVPVRIARTAAARAILRTTDLLRRPGSRLLTPMGGPPPPPPPGGPPPPGPIKEGEICDPDNLTESDLATAESKQLVCQLTGDVEDVMMPGRFMNARKGDIILSPGGTGLIGNLLRSVTPSQLYSHSGMMTRNYDEVTHSTASEEYIDSYIDEEEPTDGLPANMIKYMWPGVVAQPVEAAVNGESYTHPENGKPYSISSFSAHTVGVTHNGNFMMVPPLVVKPDPLQETDDVRTRLHGVADAARALGYRPSETAKSHYRLFCYTDPTIGQTTTAPATAGWAANTVPTVCSSMIWMSAKSKSVRLESDQAVVMPSDLDQKDIDAGAAVNPGTPDGLYMYTAAERLDAGTWLYDTIYYMGYDAAGWLGEALTDAADDMANQLCNTFANDDPDIDSEDWQVQKDANAVSPDNILWWDGPSEGGLYGYAEPLIYREPRMEPYPISKWKKVVAWGNITGTVKFNGAAVTGANLRVYEGKSAITDGNGKYTLSKVPLGGYNIVAWKVIDGKYCSINKTINLNAENMTVNLDLQPPAEDFRLATVFFDFWGEDYETFGDNEYTDPGAELVQLELGPDRLINSFTREYKWGGELRCEYTFTLKLLVGNVIDAQIDCKLYEGTTEGTDDLDGWGSLSFQVPMNETRAGTLRVWNTEEDEGEDQGILTVSVKNEQNNN